MRLLFLILALFLPGRTLAESPPSPDLVARCEAGEATACVDRAEQIVAELWMACERDDDAACRAFQRDPKASRGQALSAGAYAETGCLAGSEAACAEARGIKEALGKRP